MEENPTAVTTSSLPSDLATIRSRIGQIRDNCRNATELSPSQLEKSVRDCALELQSNMDKLLADASDIDSFPNEDLDDFLEHLKKELSAVEGENMRVSSEIEELSRRYVEDYSKLESELEGLECSINLMRPQGTMEGNMQECLDNTGSLRNTQGHSQFKILELKQKLEQSNKALKSLQDLDCTSKRFDAIEKIEGALTGVKVIEYEGNHIKLSLKTYIPIESLLSEQQIDDATEPLEQDHELLIEVTDGTLEVKNVKILPSDVYITEIVDAAKSFRQYYSPLPLEISSSLEWLVRRVQDQIFLCTVRRFVVKSADKSRHSFEYVDRDEMIIAHMVGGIDAFIKVSLGWPMSSSALNLKSLRSSSHYSKEISLSFLCKVVEIVNSWDASLRQNISSFVGRIEEVLVEQMRAELQPDNSSDK